MALAIPLYEKLDLLKENAPAIIAGISVGTLVSLGLSLIHISGAEAAHILQADRQKYGAPEYIKKNSARFSFEAVSYTHLYTG